jgi:hypothetical protein
MNQLSVAEWAVVAYGVATLLSFIPGTVGKVFGTIALDVGKLFGVRKS